MTETKFCTGSLEQAIQDAFHSENVSRPLLIYIHRDRNPFPSMIIEYLLINYIVWRWNMTNESNNEHRFVEIWETFFPDFPIENDSILIGIHREMIIKNTDFILRCQPKVLLANENINQEFLFERLNNFKQNFDRDEQYFTSKFVQKILLSRNLFLRLIKYLSLNDTIRIFTLEILSLLSKSNIKLPIIEPNVEFLKTIIPKVDPQQIDILQIEADQYKQILKYIQLNTFRYVRSLIIIDFYDRKQIPDMNIYFPILICFSCQFDKIIDLRKLSRIFHLLPNTVQQYEIHCTSIVCSHKRLRHIYMEPTYPNRTIQIFVLHLFQLSETIDDYCSQYLPKCILRTILDFIHIMIDIEYVRIVIYENYLEILLDVNEWIHLVSYCTKLNLITIEIMENIKLYSLIQAEIEDIQNKLRTIRDAIRFQVKIP